MRPVIDRGNSRSITGNDTRTTGRPTTTRPGSRTATPSPLIDLRAASAPKPTRVRFPRSYTAGERERRSETKRVERAAALERERRYGERISRDSNALADNTRTKRANPGSSRTRLSGNRSKSRATDLQTEKPRLSDLRLGQARESRVARADRAQRSAQARKLADASERKQQHLSDARKAHRSKAKTDSVYADRVRADARATQAATQVVLNAGIGIGVSIAGGWSGDFAGYTPGTDSDWCDPYDPYCDDICYSPRDDCYAWRPPYYQPPIYYPPVYGGWWNPWCDVYWGSTLIVQNTYVTEASYYEDDPLPEGEVVVAGDPLPLEETSEELRRAAGRYLQLGDEAFLMGDFGRAVHYYAKAIELSPDDGVLYLVLSDALFATGDYHYAAYSLRRALELEPALAHMEFDKHELYSNPEVFEDQLALLELYLDDHFLDEDARLLLAANYLFGGSPERALELLDDPFSVEVTESEIGGLLRDATSFAVEERE